MTWKLLYSILKADETLQTIYTMSQTALGKQFCLNEKRVSIFYKDLHHYTPEQISSYYSNHSIDTITIIDSIYPQLLKKIYDPPFVLYGKGLLHVLKSEKRIAVVGTRVPSPYGIEATNQLIPPLTKEGWTIVSGFAKGIDSISHKAAIEASAPTIAVLGSGFQHLYPKENKKIFSELSKKHYILTEYPPYIPPNKWNFPARNRIVSGLAVATVVIEAKEKSGSLITVDQALEQGREVFAVPGSIFSPNSIGTNQLIQQGAKLVGNAKDILIEIEQSMG